MQLKQYIWILMIIISTGVVSATITSNLVSWHGMYASGDTSDATGNGHTLEINGAVFNSTGKVNGAYSFYASTDKLNTTSSAYTVTTGDFSVSYWIKTSSTPTNYYAHVGYMASNGVSGWQMDNWNNGSLMFNYGTGAGANYLYVNSSAGKLTDGTWRHIVATRNGTTFKIYINGSLELTATVNQDLTPATTTYYHIGRGAYSTFIAPSGATIDEVAFWNGYSLNSSDVTTLTNIPTGYNYTQWLAALTNTVVNVTQDTPANFTYQSGSTPFTFNITSIGGTWNATLRLNGTNYGTNNSITAIGQYTIYPSGIPAGAEYLWLVNMTYNSTLWYLTGTRNIYITGGTSSSSCVVNLGNAYFRPNTCSVFP